MTQSDTILSNVARVRAYDYSNQPTLVTGAANGTYLYDGNLKRVRSVVNGRTIYNVYNMAGQLVHVDERPYTDAQAQSVPEKRTDYVSLGGKSIARVENKSTATYIFADHLGSPVATKKGSAAIKRERYTPFGIAMDDNPDLTNQGGFTGHIKDSATDLNYMQARYYDPVMGRFLSIDPVTMMDADMNPGMFNRYAYVFNDPINGADSTGMICDEGLCNKVANAIRNALPGPDNPQELVEKYGQPISDIGQTMPGGQSISNGEMQVVGALTASLGNASMGRVGPNTTAAPAATRSVTATIPKPTITQPYARPSNATTPAQRAAVQGKPCTEYGKVAPVQRANHTPPLVKEYYSTGTINTTRMRSTKAVTPHCPTCSNAEGGRMSAFSKAMKREHGFD